MFAILFQNLVTKLRNVFWCAVAIEGQIPQKGVFIEALKDFVREIVMADRQSMIKDVLNRVNTEISIDSFEQLACSVFSFRRAGKQVAIQQRLDLHMPNQQFKRFMRGKVFDTKG